MEYKSYSARVEYDDEAEIFHGEIVNIRDVVTFEGRSVDELQQAMRDSIDDYLEWCAERGKDPDRPYSGNFVVRVDPDVHRAITSEARRTGKSLNAWVADQLSRAVRDCGKTGRRRDA